MTMTQMIDEGSSEHQPSGASNLLPRFDRRTVTTVFAGGVAATLAWEIFARGIAPFWIGGPLEPAGLVMAVFGLGDRLTAELIHFVTGIVFYAAGYVFIARPIADWMARRVGLRQMPVVVTAVGYGIGLWAFALYVMAHLIAGFPPFLGFGQLTWASLVGHVLFAVVLAGVVAFRERRTA